MARNPLLTEEIHDWFQNYVVTGDLPQGIKNYDEFTDLLQLYADHNLIRQNLNQVSFQNNYLKNTLWMVARAKEHAPSMTQFYLMAAFFTMLIYLNIENKMLSPFLGFSIALFIIAIKFMVDYSIIKQDYPKMRARLTQLSESLGLVDETALLSSSFHI